MSSFINSVFSFRTINTVESTMSEDTIFVSPEFTADELAILNQEVTPEIEVLFLRMCMEKAEEEVEAFRKERFEINQARDFEKVLSEVVELQERMTKGMRMIKEADKAISSMWERNPYAGFIWACWSGRITGEKAQNCLSHKSNQTMIRWFDRRAALWNQWNKLQAECMELIGEDTWIWSKYFELADSDINTYLTTGIDEDAEEKDERICNDTYSYLQSIQDSHYEEMSYEPTMKVGYWNHSYDKKLRKSETYRLQREQEDKEFSDMLMNSIVAQEEQLAFVYA